MTITTTDYSVVLHGRTIDFRAAVALMDDDIRDALHCELAPCSDQMFLDAYVAAHAKQFGEQFVVM